MPMELKDRNISWINYVRAVCIFLVFFIHTENRAHFEFLGRTLDVFFRPFYVNAFFIVSGYLLYKKQELIFQKVKTTRDWFKDYGVNYLQNIFFKLIIPSIIFSLVIFFPKMMIRHQPIDLMTMLKQTIGGETMWFVSALVVAQLLIFIPLLFRNLSLMLWGGYGVSCFVLATVLHNWGYENFPWYYQSGLSAVFFIWLGCFFYKVENFGIFRMKFLWICVLVSYLLVAYNVPFLMDLSYMRTDVIGILLCLVSSVVLIFFCKRIQPNRIVEKIGRSTIGLYFLSGAVPEVVSILTKRFLELNSIVFLIVVLVSFALSVFLNEIMLKYVGFVFDLRNFSFKHE